jgi:Zn ribbon nucleic-acid-binding protein
MSVQTVTSCDVCNSGDNMSVGTEDRRGSFVACGVCWHARRDELSAVKEQLRQSQARIAELEVALAKLESHLDRTTKEG